MQAGEAITIRVSAIANGFLVTEERADGNYRSGRSEALFSPTIEAVERELVIRFRAAQSIEPKEDDF